MTDPGGLTGRTRVQVTVNHLRLAQRRGAAAAGDVLEESAAEAPALQVTRSQSVARVSRRGLRYTVACDAACSVTSTLRIAGGDGSGSAGPRRRIGARRFPPARAAARQQGSPQPGHRDAEGEAAQPARHARPQDQDGRGHDHGPQGRRAEALEATTRPAAASEGGGRRPRPCRSDRGHAPSDERILTPAPEPRFTFGLWTVGNPGRDPFGGPTREPLDPVDSVKKLGELGAWGISLHDEDLIPWGTPAAERDRIVARLKAALDEAGMGVGMATTNLFGHAAFKDGAFTSNDRRVRRAAIGKAMRSIDLGAELGGEVYVFWGGREGTEVGVAKDPRDALERYREAVNVLVDYSESQGYGFRFALEPKPNEPRGDIFLPTVGHALHFITMLDRPELVGLNPEVAHETMAGLSFHHAVGQALWAGKLFHIDLNGQDVGRYDQDFRFGSEDLKEAFLLVRLLERAGYDGPRHFDAHAYRNENLEGVWDFAAGCMATYRALAEKAAHFDSLPDVQEALEAASAPELALASVDGDSADTLKAESEALDTLAERGYYNERLDQILVEVLLGVR